MRDEPVRNSSPLEEPRQEIPTDEKRHIARERQETRTEKDTNLAVGVE